MRPTPIVKGSARPWLLSLCCALAAQGCSNDDGLDKTRGVSEDGASNQNVFANADAGSANPADGGGVVMPAFGEDPCKRIDVRNVDLLFLVDNSGSMREEQASLRAQFPALVRALTSGDPDQDGIQDFPAVEDLHLAVVSSDMGLVGIQGIPGCEGLGDDGIMQRTPDPALQGCQPSYPRFLSYTANVDDPAQTATDFGCIASLGTEGCGFEQQLEATLKSLWPSTDDRITFLGDINGSGTKGHGDLENQGFLRPNTSDDTSVVAIIIVSDEEDCSSRDTRHFTPKIYLDPLDPLAEQDLNLRCFLNRQNLYTVARYVQGFQALRPGLEQLVVFAAIVGVPTDLVDEAARAAVDFSNTSEREDFYDELLADPRMQETPDPNRTAEQGGNLTPSCISDSGRAFPPRRIVEVAREFGQNGIVQSICDDDFGPAIGVIIDAIGRTVDKACIVE